jgi:hypothetical protein
MTPVQPTLTVTIDDVTFDIATMSDGVRQMIAYMDDWRQKEADISSELLMARSAIRDIQNNLLTTIKQDQEKDAAANTSEAEVIAPV